MLIRAFHEADTEQVVALWEACGLLRPWNDPRRDIARKLEVQRELFLVGVEEGNGEVIASSEGYSSKSSAISGIESVKNNAADAVVEDLTI